jgi:hypothetical protein
VLPKSAANRSPTPLACYQQNNTIPATEAPHRLPNQAGSAAHVPHERPLSIHSSTARRPSRAASNAWRIRAGILHLRNYRLIDLRYCRMRNLGGTGKASALAARIPFGLNSCCRPRGVTVRRGINLARYLMEETRNIVSR